jgi:hypothetical protein
LAIPVLLLLLWLWWLWPALLVLPLLLRVLLLLSHLEALLDQVLRGLSDLR